MKKIALIFALILLSILFMVYYTKNNIKAHQEPNLASSEDIELIQLTDRARVTCYIDKGIMANGKYVNKGAVAVSDRTIPLNSKIYLEGFGEMKVEDRTAKWVHTKFDLPTIDIWMTENECINFGLKILHYTKI